MLILMLALSLSLSPFPCRTLTILCWFLSFLQICCAWMSVCVSYCHCDKYFVSNCTNLYMAPSTNCYVGNAIVKGERERALIVLIAVLILVFCPCSPIPFRYTHIMHGKNENRFIQSEMCMTYTLLFRYCFPLCTIVCARSSLTLSRWANDRKEEKFSQRTACSQKKNANEFGRRAFRCCVLLVCLFFNDVNFPIKCVYNVYM